MTVTTDVFVCRVLELARQYVRDGWCYGAAARTTEGDPTGALNREAESYCSYAAVVRAAHDLGVPGLLDDALHMLASVLPPLGNNETATAVAHIQMANDAVSQATVLGWFDKALSA